MSRFLAASDCVWFGHHVVETSGLVTYTMPGVGFGFRVSNTSRVDIKMDTGGNFFKVVLTSHGDENKTVYDLNMHAIEGELEWIRVASNLDPSKTYDLRLIKKSEPRMKSILSQFHPVRVKRVRASREAFFHPVSSKQLFYHSGYIEVIGDSDACGFGTDGDISSTINIFSMDGAHEDCTKAWGSRLATDLGLADAFVCTAWSGKGIAKNAPMCGDTRLPELWVSHHYTAPDEPPRLVAILAGGNDFFDESFPSKNEFKTEFSNFLFCLRKIRGNSVPIYVFQCAAGCCSSAGSPTLHPSQDAWAIKSSRLLHEYTLDTVEGLDKIFYHQINIHLELDSDYATMMHWSPSGHKKIAQAMAQFISSIESSGGSLWAPSATYTVLPLPISNYG